MLRLPKARATNSWFKAQSYRALDKFMVYGVFKRLGDPVTPMSDETEAAIPAIRIWGSYFVAATSAFLVSSSLGLGKSRSLPAQPGSITPSQSSEQEPSATPHERRISYTKILYDPTLHLSYPWQDIHPNAPARRPGGSNYLYPLPNQACPPRYTRPLVLDHVCITHPKLNAPLQKTDGTARRSQPDHLDCLKRDESAALSSLHRLSNVGWGHKNAAHTRWPHITAFQVPFRVFLPARTTGLVLNYLICIHNVQRQLPARLLERRPVSVCLR
ncbi:hypothetical protein QC762_117475 [Podospora pseudocomata]|uniref:Uncharacterized protein n=1 Tax=Podospora pseudocomata TaxID=2093779 RepID=A0ABR0GX94_9PEZI|nr:hypothetical protein QC762_117475 [Podospora pseudocomata]